jgi:Ca2+-binding RTX toxin-like protein
MGGGDDTFVWDPGDGSDTIEGQGGRDTMRFNGANIAEKMELAANGGRLRFTRDIGSITMDADAVERVDVRALGGADLVTVDDLGATDVRDVDVDLGAGDGAIDRVVVHGTDGRDHVRVSGDAAAVTVDGLAATVRVLDAEPADRLELETRPADDRVDARRLDAGAIQLVVA